jgi:DNA-binding beta-propeller fold protein YncE
VWARDYGRAIADWPLVHTFNLYVRRDLATELWDYAPEAQAASTASGVDYSEQWSQRAAAETWGSLGSGTGQLWHPRGGGGCRRPVYVADSQNNRVVVFDANGQYLRQWGELGSDPASSPSPGAWRFRPRERSMWRTPGTIASRCSMRTAPTCAVGASSARATSAGDSGDLLYGPRDIAISADGDVYVSDTGNKRVVRYDANGVMLGAVGGNGAEDGQFQEPVGLAFDGDGNLLVADTWNQRVQVFDAQLNYLRQWPVYAWDGLSVTNKPYLTVEGDHVYITDPDANRVLEFDGQGELVAAWGQYGSDVTGMINPTGLRVDGQGRCW